MTLNKLIIYAQLLPAGYGSQTEISVGAAGFTQRRIGIHNMISGNGAAWETR